MRSGRRGTSEEEERMWREVVEAEERWRAENWERLD